MGKRMKLNELTNHCFNSVSGVTLVEISGGCRVLVERHRGVLGYDPDRICIRATYGCVVVLGQELVLAQMTNSTLVISGKVHSVTLQRRE